MNLSLELLKMFEHFLKPVITLAINIDIKISTSLIPFIFLGEKKNKLVNVNVSEIMINKHVHIEAVSLHFLNLLLVLAHPQIVYFTLLSYYLSLFPERK